MILILLFFVYFLFSMSMCVLYHYFTMSYEFYIHFLTRDISPNLGGKIIATKEKWLPNLLSMK